MVEQWRPTVLEKVNDASQYPLVRSTSQTSSFLEAERITNMSMSKSNQRKTRRAPLSREVNDKKTGQTGKSNDDNKNSKLCLITGFFSSGTMLPVASSVSSSASKIHCRTSPCGRADSAPSTSDDLSMLRTCTQGKPADISCSSTIITVGEPEPSRTKCCKQNLNGSRANQVVSVDSAGVPHQSRSCRTRSVNHAVFVTGPVDDEVLVVQPNACTLGATLNSNLVADYDEQSADYFSTLPVELMENIFCQLPVVDLMLNCQLVCCQWYNVISNDKFIPWKKRYCRLKNKVARTENEVLQILYEAHLFEEDLVAVHLARFMKEFRRDIPSLLHYLEQHPKFPLILTFVKDQCGSEDKQQEQSYWSTVGLLTLVSSTVQDVTEIIHCMLRSSLCLVQEILECMYCLATVFYTLHTQNRIVIGLHYRVFYALYLFENSFTATCASLSLAFSQKRSGQQCLTKYRCSSDRLRLTHEQIRFVNHIMNSGDIVKIVAFAGTGKTTTLVEYTKLRPQLKFLNVAYNKSIQQHALKVFPSNVTSRTVHSLAFRNVGYRFRAKLKGNLRLSSIMNALPGTCGFLHAQRVLDTLVKFIASADICVLARHVPPRNISITNVDCLDGTGRDLSYFNSPQYVQQVVEHASVLWQKMADSSDHEVNMTHDGYLKLYQLSKPTISGFDCLLIDEAQDCTPAASDILLRQSCTRILVGDPNQQIYGFRGATNAMREVQSSHTFYLTQSFRFGPEIAYVAACTLDALKGVHHKTLVGGAQPGGVCGDIVGQLAIITRCNHTLFNEAVKVCCANNDIKVAFAGGLQSYNLDRVLDIYRLFSADKTKRLMIQDSFIKKFLSFSALKKFAKAAPDPELLGKIKIVETHHVMLPTRIEKIRSKTCEHMEQAKIIFTTAHKAKGLEFDSVQLTDDFLMDSEFGVPFHEQQEDEKNLVYVAVTRAKKRLLMTTTLLHILAARKEYFVEAALPKQVLPVGCSITCVQCNTEELFNRKRHIIEKRQIKLGNGVTCVGGILCSSCALKAAPHLSCLISPSGVQ